MAVMMDDHVFVSLLLYVEDQIPLVFRGLEFEALVTVTSPIRRRRT